MQHCFAAYPDARFICCVMLCQVRFAGIDCSGAALDMAKAALLGSCEGLAARNISLVCREYTQGGRPTPCIQTSARTLETSPNPSRQETYALLTDLCRQRADHCLTSSTVPDVPDVLRGSHAAGVAECRRLFPDQQLVVLWLGSSIGNLSPAEAVQFFRDMTASAGTNIQVGWPAEPV